MLCNYIRGTFSQAILWFINARLKSWGEILCFIVAMPTHMVTMELLALLNIHTKQAKGAKYRDISSEGASIGRHRLTKTESGKISMQL